MSTDSAMQIVRDLAAIPPHRIGEQHDSGLTWFCKYCGVSAEFGQWRHSETCVYNRSRLLVARGPKGLKKGETP